MELLEELNQIVSMFHISQLRKCLNYVERPVAILERKVKVLHNKKVSLVKVQWRHQRGSEWAWELEAEMLEHYLDLFTIAGFEYEA